MYGSSPAEPLVRRKNPTWLSKNKQKKKVLHGGVLSWGTFYLRTSGHAGQKWL